MLFIQSHIHQNEGVRKYIARELACEILAVPESQLAGALGAAILAREKAGMK